MLTVLEEGPVEEAERLGAENIQDGNSVKSLTFGGTFLQGHGNSPMKSTVLNVFPPMLQFPLMIHNSSLKMQLPSA